MGGRALLGLLAAGLALGACGGSGDSAEPTTSAVSAATTASTGTSPSTTLAPTTAARSSLVWWFIGSACRATQLALSLPHSQPICPVSDIVLCLGGNTSTFIDGYLLCSEQPSRRRP